MIGKTNSNKALDSGLKRIKTLFSLSICPGWEGVNCDVDILECNQTINPCGDRGKCVELPGSFECDCDPGFTGKGDRLLTTAKTSEEPSSCGAHYHLVPMTQGDFKLE